MAHDGSSVNVCCLFTYFPPCSDQVPDNKQLKGERIVFCSWFEGIAQLAEKALLGIRRVVSFILFVCLFCLITVACGGWGGVFS